MLIKRTGRLGVSGEGRKEASQPSGIVEVALATTTRLASLTPSPPSLQYTFEQEDVTLPPIDEGDPKLESRFPPRHSQSAHLLAGARPVFQPTFGAPVPGGSRREGGGASPAVRSITASPWASGGGGGGGGRRVVGRAGGQPPVTITGILYSMFLCKRANVPHFSRSCACALAPSSHPFHTN